MATHLAFTLLMLAVFDVSQANNAHSAAALKPFLDPKRRSEIVDETFLEQKDILLDMLEAKLKEVRDRKKKKALNLTEVTHTNTNNNFEKHDPSKLCNNLLQNVDVKVKINGISAIGDADLQLKYGNSGKGTVNLEANGISNVGKVHMEMGVGDSAVYIPGLSNLFIDRKFLNCTQNASSTAGDKRADDTRRIGIENSVVDITNKIDNENVTQPHTHQIKNTTIEVSTLEMTTSTPSIDTTVTVNSTSITSSNNTV